MEILELPQLVSNELYNTLLYAWISVAAVLLFRVLGASMHTKRRTIFFRNKKYYSDN
jgi:hypothetical protein